MESVYSKVSHQVCFYKISGDFKSTFLIEHIQATASIILNNKNIWAHFFTHHSLIPKKQVLQEVFLQRLTQNLLKNLRWELPAKKAYSF